MEKISTIPQWGTWWFDVSMSWSPSSKLKKINKAVEWSDEWIGEYVKDRAIKRGETTTSVIKRGDSWKVLVKYIK